MKEVMRFLENEIFTENNLSVVVACSGGPDSMALLDIILKLRNKKGVNIICAHVNHKLRIESEHEKIDVENFCKTNNIIFEYMEITNYNNDNFHAQARNIRYEFFDKLMNKYNAQYLFTAHHGDDLIETILMRISRGSTVKGYSGFNKISKRNNYHIVKPLIYVTKEQLLEYVKENNIYYAIDKSNENEVYTRNRYRKNILPFLKEENKEVHLKYLKFSEQLAKYENYIQKEVMKYIPYVITDNVLEIDKFNILDVVIKEEIIKYILEKEYKKGITVINNSHIEQIFQLINTNKPNSFINLPNGIRIVKEYNNLFISSSLNEQKDYMIELNKEIIINENIIKIINETDDASNYTIKLNSTEIKLPLYIRNIKVSDKIMIKGLNGSKKVKDIYIDLKIPKEKRYELPILIDSNDNILWLPGLKKSKYDKSKSGNYDIIVKYMKKEENNEKEN